MNDRSIQSATRFHAAFLVMQIFSLVTFFGVFLLWVFFMIINWERLPIWEGRIFPVVQDFRLLNHTESHNGKTLIWVSFEKDRPCQFIRNDAYYSFADGRKFVDIKYSELTDAGTTFSRPVGDHVSGPWELNVPHAQFDPKRLRIDSVHVCHPAFMTITPAFGDNG